LKGKREITERLIAPILYRLDGATEEQVAAVEGWREHTGSGVVAAGRGSDSASRR
jgi:hypothetical protein